MATETEQLVVSLEARIRDFEKNIERANRTANAQFSAIERRAKEAGDRMEKLMSSTALSVNRALGAIGVGVGFEEIRRFADAWTEAGNKIKAAATATGVQTRSLDELKKGANEARTSLDAYIDLYARLTRAAAGVAKSEDEIARATAITTKAFKAGGASASEAAGAALQLGQALGSGVLQGDELRSLRENAPILAQAIADAFGVPLAALKSLGEQGKLTSDKVFGAILAAQAKVEAQFYATTATIEDSMTRLKNEFTAYVGKMAEAHGVSAAFRSVIEGLAGHVDAVANGAAALAAVLLTRYLPALVRTAAAQAAVVSTNPFLLIATAAGAAAAALTIFSDEIHPVAGSIATLGDYAAVAWEEIKSGAQTAAAAIGSAFTAIVDFASNALSGVGASWRDVADVVRGVANFVVHSMVTVYETVTTTFGKLPQAVAEAAIDAMNGLIKRIEDALNSVVGMVNDAVTILNGLLTHPTGIKFGEVAKIDLGRIENEYAGAGEAAGKAYGDALAEATRDRVGQALSALNGQADAALEAWRKRAEEHAAKAKADADAAATGNHFAPIGGTRQTMPVDQVKEVVDLQQKLVMLRAEMALRRSIPGSIEAQEAAVERLKTAQDLANAATKAGVVLTDDVKSKIGALADAYSRASQEAKALAKSQQGAAQKAADLANTSRDTFKGFVSDLVHGKSASDALATALGRIGDKLLDMAMDNLWQSLVMNNGGTGFFGSLGSLFTSPTKPVYAPGSALQGVNFGGSITTPTAVVNAGSVSVNGATLGGVGSIFSDSTLNRSSFNAELSDKSLLTRLFAMTNAEVGGQGSAAQQAFMETIFNRASARGMSLASVLNDRGYFPAETFANADRFMADPAMLEQKYAALLAQVRAGSNLSNYATGNASGSVGFGGGPQTFAAGGEKFGIEQADMAWAARMKEQAQAFSASTDRAGQSLSNLGDKATGITEPVTQAADATQNLGQKASTATPELSNMTTNTAQLTPQLQQGSIGLEGFGEGLMGIVQKLLGSLGGGLGGVGSIFGLLRGIFGFAEGGRVSGPGTSTSDSIPAMLSDGEFVINAKATARHLPLLEAINEGKVSRFASGGLVGSSQPIRVPNGGTVVGQSVTVSPTINLHSNGGTPEQNADLAGKVSKQVTESLRALVIGELSNQMRHGGVLAKAMGK